MSRNKGRTPAEAQNQKSYIQYYNRLTELAISMFEWKNLPDSCDERFLEMCLFSDGMNIFFKDEVLGFLNLQCMIGGKLDVYRIPTIRNAYASNGYNKKLDEKDSVIIYNNYLHTNSMLDIEQYSKRLANLDRTIDVNCNAQRTPVLVTCTETEKATMLRMYEQYEGNEPFIFGDKGLNPKGLNVLKTEAPYHAQELYELKTQIWNEALTYLGISNTNVTKKERMVSDEVVRGMGGVIASRYSRLQARRTAVEKINTMFGLEIEVNYREDYREADDEFMLSGATEDGKAVTMINDLATRSKYDESQVRN